MRNPAWTPHRSSRRRQQRLDDGGIGVGLDGVVSLDARQVFFERDVIAPQFVMVHHEQRRAVFRARVFSRRRLIISVSVGNQEVFELPRIVRVNLWTVVPVERIVVVLQRRPVNRLGIHFPRYGLEIFRMYPCGRSSGTQTPLAGFSIIHIAAAIRRWLPAWWWRSGAAPAGVIPRC